MRLSEDERRYREWERSGKLKQLIGAYAIGQRSSDILDGLAQARVWSHNIGEWLPVPSGFARFDWTDILDHLVLSRLGNRRCCDCGAFFSDEKAGLVSYGPIDGPTAYVPVCHTCGSNVTEVIGTTEGVVR